MSVTQDYKKHQIFNLKTVTVSVEQLALLKIAVAEDIGRAVRNQNNAVTLDIEDAYAERERELRTIYALLGAA